MPLLHMMKKTKCGLLSSSSQKRLGMCVEERVVEFMDSAQAIRAKQNEVFNFKQFFDTAKDTVRNSVFIRGFFAQEGLGSLL